MKYSAQLALAASLALAGCAVIPPADNGPAPPLPSPQSPVPAPEPVPPSPEGRLIYAALGQTVTVDRVRITPLKVLEDSRCPMNARCVWAGQVRLRIRAALGSGVRTLEITSNKPIPIGEHKLELVEVTPPKMAGRNHGAVMPGTYRFGFRFAEGL